MDRAARPAHASRFLASAWAAGRSAWRRASPRGLNRHRFSPRHNGKVERHHRILAEELLYARLWTSETQRAQAIDVWNVHYNYHRPHTATGNRPPAQRLHAGVTNVMAGNN